MKEEKQEYDLESVYDEQIFPLMGKIIAICKEHNMPFLATFQYSWINEEDANLCSSGLLPENRPVAPEIEAAYNAITGRGRRALSITTRDASGKITAMETIL